VYLKTLSLAGFKSFADRTRLDFEAGVTVVVGPNGSGKSNLLDALAWVMGTQATSALRTEKMEDVIFAGTTTRPPLGRAEVVVTFDNADRFLPLDLNEITMTRRLYRDGTSEYALNGTPCRLLDLHELLSDGGVGRHQHVLVGQGQIGTILSARADEHRSVIEEAAGITKHRQRRDRSIRRLEQTDIDVTRLTDILDEQRRHLRPLKRQANAAERHEGVRAEIRALRLWLGGEQLRSLRSRLTADEAEHTTLTEAIAAHGEERRRIVADLSDLRKAAGEVGRALERDTAAAARLETVAERYHRIALVARERRYSFESRRRGAGERRHDLEEESARIAAEIESCIAEERAAATQAERREVALEALEDEERSLAEQVRLPAEAVVATLRGDLRALENAAERDRREAEAVERRREVVAARLAEEQHDSDTLVEEIQSTDAEVGRAQAAHAAARQISEHTRDELEQAEEGQRRDELAMARATARVEAVEAALAGLGDPEAFARARSAEAVLGTVVERLDVPADLGPAVDGALGEWRNSLVAAGRDELRDLIGDLKSGGLGGLTFVLSDTRAEGSSVAAGLGAEALVDRLGPGADRELAGCLLGDVVLVEGWSSGWTLVERHPEFRAVTPEGDVISRAGMYLADPDGAGPAALEAARVAAETTDRELARSASRCHTARRAFEEASDAERQALEMLEELEARLAGHTEALALNARARGAGEDEMARLDERLAGLGVAATAREERLAELRRHIEEFEGEERVRQEAWDALNRRREDVARRRDEARRLREEAAAALASTRERRRLLENRHAVVTAEMASFDDAPGDPEAVAELQAIEDEAQRALTVVRGHVSELRLRQRGLREESGLADGRLAAAHARQDELDTALNEAKDKASALAIELAELRVRNEAVAEGLRRDADASQEEALAAAAPEREDDVDAGERLASLEAQLRRMGPINPLAAAEYRELAAEVETLEAQLADLEESRHELRKVIRALDDEMALLFVTAFEEISALFSEHFSLVFPGGRGHLCLTDPDRPLESGVEIEAQPLGKKIGRLSLLSGGERSLAALAFLFAVFRARPSPFYVLDEVEAALDDANLRRFLRLVDTLRESAQLVIITHQPQTMEAADILYGVTMEPGESSQVLAKRIHEPAI